MSSRSPSAARSCRQPLKLTLSFSFPCRLLGTPSASTLELASKRRAMLPRYIASCGLQQRGRGHHDISSRNASSFSHVHENETATCCGGSGPKSSRIAVLSSQMTSQFSSSKSVSRKLSLLQHASPSDTSSVNLQHR